MMKKPYNEIEGWFDHELAYDFIIKNTPLFGTIVELGAWLGKSSAYLCDNSTQKIFIVDTWQGSPDELTTNHKLATETDIFEIFKLNMKGRSYTPIRMESSEAAKQFEDNSIDAVFIDMTHSYDAVKQDILTWLPKVKTNGIIAGDDYHQNWKGVIKAVDEFFPCAVILGDAWIEKVEK